MQSEISTCVYLANPSNLSKPRFLGVVVSNRKPAYIEDSAHKRAEPRLQTSLQTKPRQTALTETPWASCGMLATGIDSRHAVWPHPAFFRRWSFVFDDAMRGRVGAPSKTHANTCSDIAVCTARLDTAQSTQSRPRRVVEVLRRRRCSRNYLPQQHADR